MTRKSGLHKRVSSIFGDIPIPPPSGNGGMSNGYPPPGSDNRQYPNGQPLNNAIPRVSERLTEEQEYAASQRKKLILVILLATVLGVVLFLNFYNPQQTKAEQTPTETGLIIASKNIDIQWSEPGVWPSNIKDPMARNSSQVINKIKNEGALTLRGIVGGSMVLIGTEILNKGDEYQGWKVMEILEKSVLLEKRDGEKLELKMETDDR